MSPDSVAGKSTHNAQHTTHNAPFTVHPIHHRGVTYPKGFKAAAVRAGLKSKNLDLALIVSEEPAAAAGVFTKNVVKASCVLYSKKVAANGLARAIYVNAGNANACNGPQGDKDNEACAQLTARALGFDPGAVLTASTGVIGRLMPMEKIESAVPQAAAALARSDQADEDVSRAIMTTDTRPKQVALEVESPHWEGVIRFGGVAKGSGMIAPNMATTLGFVTTDAKIEPMLLQSLLKEAVDHTFNRITVDGDTSTNDMVLVLANGASGCEITEESKEDFYQGLEQVLLHLAKEVARDGEGATKLVAVHVKGASNDADATKVAKTIAESPLVKTALFGSDPNWGRLMMAAGRSGVEFDPNEADAYIGEYQVFAKGAGAAFDRMAGHHYLKSDEVDLLVSIGNGPGKSTYWTCDYSYDYVKINAEYHT